MSGGLLVGLLVGVFGTVVLALPRRRREWLATASARLVGTAVVVVWVQWVVLESVEDWRLRVAVLAVPAVLAGVGVALLSGEHHRPRGRRVSRRGGW